MAKEKMAKKTKCFKVMVGPSWMVPEEYPDSGRSAPKGGFIDLDPNREDTKRWLKSNTIDGPIEPDPRIRQKTR